MIANRKNCDSSSVHPFYTLAFYTEILNIVALILIET